MKISQVAAQSYTVRDFMQNPADIAESLKKIRKIGYEAVQISGIGPMAEEELKSIMDGEGLICCATHEKTEMILNDPDAVNDRIAKLNCRYASLPYPEGVDFSSISLVADFAAKIDRSGEVLRRAGNVLTYHNHSVEFQRVEGRLVLDLIFDNTDAANLMAEIDTYWVQHGGGDPADWCRKLAGRLPLLHMKDYVITKGFDPTFAEIGKGNLNWKKIVAEAEKAGCKWFIVEQDTCQRDPFESLKISFEFINGQLCS